MAEVSSTLTWRAPEILTALRAEMVRRLKLAAGVVERRAKEKCPVKTGALRDSIRTAPIVDTPTLLEARIGSDLHYAPYVERGTERMSARNYLKDALNASRPDIYMILETGHE